MQTEEALKRVHEEAEKRKARAAKFGVELQEESNEKKKARMERFANPDDEDDKEKKKARLERFGGDLQGMGLKKKNVLEMSLDEYKLKKSKKLDKAGKLRKKRAGFKTKDGSKKTLRLKSKNGQRDQGRKFKKGFKK